MAKNLKVRKAEKQNLPGEQLLKHSDHANALLCVQAYTHVCTLCLLGAPYLALQHEVQSSPPAAARVPHFAATRQLPLSCHTLEPSPRLALMQRVA